MKAPKILNKAVEEMQARAVARDKPQGERSMLRTVRAFNELTAHHLSERDGWLFMVMLKMARATTTDYGQLDDYVDMAAYASLAGECIPEKEPNEKIIEPFIGWGERLEDKASATYVKKSDRWELEETKDGLDKEYEATYGRSKES